MQPIQDLKGKLNLESDKFTTWSDLFTLKLILEVVIKFYLLPTIC